MFVESLYTVLTTDAAITALLKPKGQRKDKTTGVFLALAPTQADLPYLEFAQAAAAQVNSMDGVNRLQTCRYDLNCYASTALGTAQLAEAIKLAIGGLQGIVGTVQLQDVVLTRESNRETTGWTEGTGSMAALLATMYNTVLSFEFTFVDLA